MAPKLKPMSSCKLEMDSVDGTEGLGHTSLDGTVLVSIFEFDSKWLFFEQINSKFRANWFYIDVENEISLTSISLSFSQFS